MTETAISATAEAVGARPASDKVSIVMFSGTADKFIPLGVLAQAGAAMGMEVRVFVTGFALHACTKERHELPFPAELVSLAPAVAPRPRALVPIRARRRAFDRRFGRDARRGRLCRSSDGVGEDFGRASSPGCPPLPHRLQRATVPTAVETGPLRCKRSEPGEHGCRILVEKPFEREATLAPPHTQPEVPAGSDEVCLSDDHAAARRGEHRVDELPAGSDAQGGRRIAEGGGELCARRQGVRLSGEDVEGEAGPRAMEPVAHPVDGGEVHGHPGCEMLPEQPGARTPDG